MKDINSKYLTRENYASYSINKADQIDSLMMWKNTQVERLDSMVMKMNAGLRNSPTAPRWPLTSFAPVS